MLDAAAKGECATTVWQRKSRSARLTLVGVRWHSLAEEPIVLATRWLPILCGAGENSSSKIIKIEATASCRQGNLAIF